MAAFILINIPAVSCVALCCLNSLIMAGSYDACILNKFFTTKQVKKVRIVEGEVEERSEVMIIP